MSEWTKEAYRLECVECGKVFPAYRRDAKTCSLVCKTRKNRRAEKERKAREANAEK